MRYDYRKPLPDGMRPDDLADANLQRSDRRTGRLSHSSARRELVLAADDSPIRQMSKVGGRPLLRSDVAESPATVFVVDADASVRDHVEALIQRSGWQAKSFASGQGFLAQHPAPGPCCLVLELTLPDLCGLEVQRRMAVNRLEMPVIFITDSSDLRRLAQVVKAGAVELLPKPIDCEALLGAVRSALDASRAALAQAAETRALQARYASLSCREREVMALVVEGLQNKQVGGKLGITEITVKAHRGQVMRKMQARTLVDLVHMSAKLRAAIRPGAPEAS